VEAGVLETAARLFKVEFRPTTAQAWHKSVSVFEVLMPTGMWAGLPRHASARRQR